MKVNGCVTDPEISIIGEDNMAFYKRRESRYGLYRYKKQRPWKCL